MRSAAAALALLGLAACGGGSSDRSSGGGASYVGDAQVFVSKCLSVTLAGDRPAAMSAAGFSQRLAGHVAPVRYGSQLVARPGGDSCTLSYGRVFPAQRALQPAVVAELARAGFSPSGGSETGFSLSTGRGDRMVFSNGSRSVSVEFAGRGQTTTMRRVN